MGILDILKGKKEQEPESGDSQYERITGANKTSDEQYERATGATKYERPGAGEKAKEYRHKLDDLLGRTTEKREKRIETRTAELKLREREMSVRERESRLNKRKEKLSATGGGNPFASSMEAALGMGAPAKQPRVSRKSKHHAKSEPTYIIHNGKAIKVKSEKKHVKGNRGPSPKPKAKSFDPLNPFKGSGFDPFK